MVAQKCWLNERNTIKYYAVLLTDADGCDHLEVLYLTVIDVNTPGGEVCSGDSVALSLSASLSDTFRQDSLLPKRARPGDVLCTDGSVLSADSFSRALLLTKSS